MNYTPFSVFWDKGNTVIIAWDWVSQGIDFSRFRAVHFFAVTPNLPFGLEEEKSNQFSYLTTLYPKRSDNGLQYFFMRDRVVNSVRVLVESPDGSFKENEITYISGNTKHSESPSVVDGEAYLSTRSFSLHLGLIEYNDDPERLWPMIELQNSATSASGELPIDVLSRIEEFAATPRSTRHRYTLGCESILKSEGGEERETEFHTVLQLKHPPENLEIKIEFLQRDKQVQGSENQATSAIGKLFQSRRKQSFIVRISGRLRLLPEDWPDQIAFFVIHDSWLRAINDVRKVQEAAEPIFSDVQQRLAGIFGQERMAKSLFSLDSGENSHVEVRLLGDLLEFGELTIAADQLDDAIEVDLSGIFGDFVPGDRFGVVGAPEVRQVLSWGTGNRLLKADAKNSNPCAIFRFLADGFAEVSWTETADRPANYARRAAESKIGAGTFHIFQNVDRIHQFAGGLPVGIDAAQLVRSFEFIRDEFQAVCDFPTPGESEVASNSILEILSYLSLIEVGESSAHVYQAPVQLDALGDHRYKSGLDHMLVSHGFSPGKAKFAYKQKDKGEKPQSWPLLLAAIGIAGEQAKALLKWDMHSIAAFVSLIGDKANREKILEARLIPEADGTFDAATYASLCAGIETRLGTQDLRRAIAWGLEQGEDSEGRKKLAEDLVAFTGNADGWLTIQGYREIEKLFLLSTQGEREKEKKVRRILTKLGLDPGMIGRSELGSLPGIHSAYQIAKAWYEKLIVIGELVDPGLSEILENESESDYSERLWNKLACGLEEHFVKRTLPDQIEALVNRLEEWAGAGEIAVRLQKQRGREIGDQKLLDRVYGVLGRVVNRTAGQTEKWFNGHNDLEALIRQIDQRIAHIYDKAADAVMPANLPDREAATAYSRILVCHRMSSQIDPQIVGLTTLARELARKNKLPAALAKQLLAIQWLRNALPQSLGQLVSQCQATMEEMTRLGDIARIKRPAGLKPINTDAGSLRAAEAQS